MADETDSDRLKEAADWLRSARHVVVFTGAGISAESGIPTFRDAAGLWTEFPPDQFATWQGIMAVAAKSPGRLARFLIALLEPLAEARPNAAHAAVAALEKHTRVTVVTQNIDGLHQEAGSSRVLQVHGTLLEVVDRTGQLVRRLTRDDLRTIVARLRRMTDQPARSVLLPWAIRPMAGLRPRGTYRPRIVLFGDAMAEPDWSQAMEAAEACDCVLSIGTSRTVMPAAMLPSQARAAGATVIEVGLDACTGDICLRGKAGDIVPALVALAHKRHN
ncbi:MAG TPA: Sir2 family NAD-dependent protein deacetylase [Phycisphaerae bacterium]|nr:Sir2 family NAD-dependent protein deacetylase [Phycisphaerae bacterium]HPP26016.1 Sir2 family NAD-dependent protein deacetylase [Phycisphaerae bacterium]